MELFEMETPRDREGFIVLERKYSSLYKKTNYTTPLTLMQNRIYEYDIRSANLSTLRASSKIDDKTLDKLEELPKQEREAAVGKMIRRDRSVYKIISKGILRAREQLFRENGIQDSDVVAIKNDAVFIAGRKLTATQFGPIEFRCKNQYSIFQKIDGIELYYDRRHRKIDIKGVSDNVLAEPDHQNGMIQFFLQVLDYLSLDRRDELRRYLIQFVHDYKAKNLPHEYYRELNSANVYRTIIELSGFGYNLIQIGEDDLHMVNPIYNYTRYILPLVRMYL